MLIWNLNISVLLAISYGVTLRVWLFFCNVQVIFNTDMGKNEDFGKVLGAVTELMDVRGEDVVGKSRVAEVVDARWMCIYLMREKGYSTKQISLLIHHPIRSVNHALNGFSDRVKYSYNNLGNILAIARQQVL